MAFVKKKKTKKRKMVRWVAYNYMHNMQFEMTKKMHVQTELEAKHGEDLSAATQQVLQNLFDTAYSTRLAFGDEDTRMLLLFQVHNDGFLEMQYFNQRHANYLEIATFFRFVFAFLRPPHYTHMRWAKPFKRLDIRDALFAECFMMNDYHCAIIVDSKYAVKPDMHALRLEREPEHDFVLYWKFSAVPERWRVPEDKKNFFYYKRRLDYWREFYEVPEGKQSTRTLLKTSEAANLWQYYYHSFNQMLIEFVPEDTFTRDHFTTLLKSIQPNLRPKLSIATQTIHTTFLHTLRPQLLMYFARQFHSKYAFLFAIAQFWRLHHWISLQRFA